MQFNYSFEVASLLFMLLILIHFMAVRQFPTAKTRVFRALLIVSIAECVFNVLSSIGLANAEFVPQIVNEVLAFVFFAFEGLSLLMIYKYTVVISELDPKQKKWAALAGLIPAVFFYVFLLLTPFIGFYYYFQDGVYHQGRGANFGYFYVMLFFALNFVMLIARRKVINMRERNIIYFYTATAFIAIIVQYFNRTILLSSFGNSVIIIMVYLAMQNPNDLLDTVTGIGNEAALELQLKDALGRSKEGTVIVIKIRQYQQMNMLFGTENGNMLMAEVGQYLFNLGGKFHVFRSESDTFAVLSDKEHYRGIVKSIEDRFAEEWRIEENHILIDYAIVIMHYPKDFKSIPEFFGIKSYLLSAASESAVKDPIETDEKMIEGYYRQNKIEMILERAIRERSIQVYYQPIYSLQEKRIVSLEALSRLFDEELGYIPPSEFIPIAEKNGDIVRIGEIVLEECCKFLSRHVLSNMSLGIHSIQINISVAQCMQQNLKEAILPILQKYHIPSSMIVLELTESTAINAPVLMEHHMKELGNAGISFAMDDYGTGNANCSYLVRFPFREVKIDREMTWAYFNNETARVVIGNEIKTMQKLGIPMVVEGVEKLEQSEEMERLGVEYIQGYYYGRPLPEMECLRYIRNFNSTPEDYGR